MIPFEVSTRHDFIVADLLYPAPHLEELRPPHVPSLVAADRVARGVVRVELDWRARRAIRRELARNEADHV